MNDTPRSRPKTRGSRAAALAGVVAALLLLPLLERAPAGESRRAAAERTSSEPSSGGPAGRPGAAESGATRATSEAPPIPEIPAEKLPARTRARPDPGKDRYERDPVFVWVGEVVTPQTGDAYAPPLRVTETYLKAYFARAGHPVLDDPSRARLRVDGDVKIRFHSELFALDQRVGWKYRAAASFRVISSAGEDRGSFEIPELFEENVKSEESAVLHLRRHLAKIAWENLCQRVEGLADRRAGVLLNALAVEGEASSLKGLDREVVETTEDVVNALADIGLRAVPQLLDAMTDGRIVRMPSSYPGLAGRNLDDLRVYHVADKALEEIFQKISRMDLDTEFRLRMVILRGWENEWKRFCPSFAERSRTQDAKGRAESEGAKAKSADGPVSVR